MSCRGCNPDTRLRADSVSMARFGSIIPGSRGRWRERELVSILDPRGRRDDDAPRVARITLNRWPAGESIRVSQRAALAPSTGSPRPGGKRDAGRARAQTVSHVQVVTGGLNGKRSAYSERFRHGYTRKDHGGYVCGCAAWWRM